MSCMWFYFHSSGCKQMAVSFKLIKHVSKYFLAICHNHLVHTNKYHRYYYHNSYNKSLGILNRMVINCYNMFKFEYQVK